MTECAGVVEPVTFVARTHVTPERVGAVAVFAQVVVFFAFVDVFEDYLYFRLGFDIIYGLRNKKRTYPGNA